MTINKTTGSSPPPPPAAPSETSQTSPSPGTTEDSFVNETQNNPPPQTVPEMLGELNTEKQQLLEAMNSTAIDETEKNEIKGILADLEGLKTDLQKLNDSGKTQLPQDLLGKYDQIQAQIVEKLCSEIPEDGGTWTLSERVVEQSMSHYLDEISQMDLGTKKPEYFAKMEDLLNKFRAQANDPNGNTAPIESQFEALKEEIEAAKG